MWRWVEGWPFHSLDSPILSILRTIVCDNRPEIRHWWLVALWNILNKSLCSGNWIPFILDKRLAIWVLHCGTRGLSGSLVCNQRCLGNLSPGLGLGSRGILAVSLDLLLCPHFVVKCSCAACGSAAWWGPCWGWWRAGRESRFEMVKSPAWWLHWQASGQTRGIFQLNVIILQHIT